MLRLWGGAQTHTPPCTGRREGVTQLSRSNRVTPPYPSPTKGTEPIMCDDTPVGQAENKTGPQHDAPREPRIEVPLYLLLPNGDTSTGRRTATQPPFSASRQWKGFA